jgi:hypothetical protein
MIMGHFVRPGFRYEIVGAEQGFECAGISPPALQLVVGESTFLDIEIVYVSDFEFPAAGGLQATF